MIVQVQMPPNPMMATQNAYYMQLQQVQKQQQMQALQGVKFDVPQGWAQEKTEMKFQNKVLCCGKNQLFTETQSLGKIVFFRGLDCSCICIGCDPQVANCLKCNWYGHQERKFYFNNIPDETCPVEVELCCLKTALIRYKGAVIGRVEKLISNLCSSENRFIVRPIDESRDSMILVPVLDCKYCCDTISGNQCHCTRTIEVQKRGKPYTTIKNSWIPNAGCVCAWDLMYAPYARGEINFNPDMKDDEKVLLVVGWIIQQGFLSRVL